VKLKVGGMDIWKPTEEATFFITYLGTYRIYIYEYYPIRYMYIFMHSNLTHKF
jgi:hypothetical protein